MSILKLSSGERIDNPTLLNIYESIEKLSVLPNYSIQIESNKGVGFKLLHDEKIGTTGEYHYERGILSINLSKLQFTQQRLSSILYDFGRGRRLKDISELDNLEMDLSDITFYGANFVSILAGITITMFVLAGIKFHDSDIKNYLIPILLSFFYSCTEFKTLYLSYYGVKTIGYNSFKVLSTFPIVVIGILIYALFI